jgi:predicted HD phosphohydrolase
MGEGALNLEELIEYLTRLGDAPSVEAESFTELDHGLQCAWNLWELRGNDTELVLAGLVHDIGHRLGADEEHGWRGADAVRPVLGERVAALVAGHIPAKRYLVATDASYAAVLSPISVVSLAHQGGAATREEIAEWESSVYFADAVELRRADDLAKVPGRAVPDLDHWIPLLRAQATLLHTPSQNASPTTPSDGVIRHQ